jgi:hypothetical protein
VRVKPAGLIPVPSAKGEAHVQRHIDEEGTEEAEEEEELTR